MRTKLFLRSALVFPLLLGSGFSASVNQLVVFGDSLSDTGNAYIATGGLAPGPNYWNGRFTDGPTTTPATSGPIGLWADQLAVKLGVPDPQPYLAGGTDFAVASAKTGSNGAFNITDQVNIFSSASLGKASPTTLYAIWGGANDLYFGGNAPVAAADLLANNIKTLAGEGAKTFLWMNLPPLGSTPLGVGSQQGSLLNAGSVLFNNEWSADIASLRGQGINVIGVDVYSIFGQVAQNPGAYGFADIKDPARGLTTVDPNTYLFWDQEHPTTAGHALVANAAYTDLLVATPEPASFLFTAFGMGGLLVVGRIRAIRLSAGRSARK